MVVKVEIGVDLQQAGLVLHRNLVMRPGGHYHGGHVHGHHGNCNIQSVTWLLSFVAISRVTWSILPPWPCGHDRSLSLPRSLQRTVTARPLPT